MAGKPEKPEKPKLPPPRPKPHVPPKPISSSKPSLFDFIPDLGDEKPNAAKPSPEIDDEQWRILNNFVRNYEQPTFKLSHAHSLCRHILSIAPKYVKDIDTYFITVMAMCLCVYHAVYDNEDQYYILLTFLNNGARLGPTRVSFALRIYEIIFKKKDHRLPPDYTSYETLFRSLKK
jgi:hypothetical protein